MAKTKTPFLSMGSSGTVGGVLTSQKSGGVTILRKTPVPTDPYSLAQAYQRWDYRDNAYLWTLLTNSQKQVYRTRASRYHITGFSLWMREHLKDLPDLAGRWHLDNIIGGQVLDSSRNTNHGTVFGASLVDGIIDNALAFDGVDNAVLIPNHPSLALDTSSTGGLTLSFFVKRNLLFETTQMIIHKGRNYQLYFATNDRLVFAFFDGAWRNYISTSAITDTISHHIGLAFFDADSVIFYIDGILDVARATTFTASPTITPVSLAGDQPGDVFYLDALLDHVAIYNVPKDATEIKRHSERSYP